jgi:hypothetical protein
VALLDRCKKAFGQFKDAEQQLAAAQSAPRSPASCSTTRSTTTTPTSTSRRRR